MPNSLGGINLAQIAEEGLRVLSPRLAPLRMFTRDFSMDVKEKGESVTTRIATDLEADDVSGGFTASDATSTPYLITLDQELGKAHAFTQAEISKGGMELIRRTFFKSMGNAVGKGVTKALINLVIEANFANKTVIASADFDADDCSVLAEGLDTLDVDDSERFGLIKPAWMGALCRDNVIQGQNTSGSDEALRENRVRRVAGFELMRYNGWPTTGQTTVEGLSGFVGAREGLLIAARLPAVPDEAMQVMYAQNLVEPESGFPIQFQVFYVPKERKWYMAMATLFGVKAGPGNNIWRITTA